MGKNTNTKAKGPTLAIHLPRDPGQLHTHCFASWAAIKADPAHFTNPPDVVKTDAELAALATALQNAAGKDPVAITAVHVAAAKVRQTWGLLAKYAQGVLRAGAIEDAAAIIANILMYESKVGKRAPKPALEAKRGATSGLVRLIALAVPSAVLYYWESSLDQTTWVAGPQTAQAHALFPGLTPGKVYYFRFRVFTRKGVMMDPSQAVSLMVT